MTEPNVQPARQVRCVHCLREQYAPAVAAISRGDGVCSWCYQPSRPLTAPEYRAALCTRLDAEIEKIATGETRQAAAATAHPRRDLVSLTILLAFAAGVMFGLLADSIGWPAAYVAPLILAAAAVLWLRVTR